MPRPHPGDAQADIITVRVPIAFRRRGGRKTVTAPDGSAIAAASPRANSTLVKAIPRAFRWRKLIESGQYGSIQEIAAAENINASYVGRVLRLTLLAPDIVERILNRGNRDPLRSRWTGSWQGATSIGTSKDRRFGPRRKNVSFAPGSGRLGMNEF
jgi:hypothetical protein